MNKPVRALHVNDCAFTAENLVREAHSRALPWSFQPVAAPGRTWHGPVAQVERAALGAAWLTRLGARAARNDLLHVHSAGVVRHTRIVPKAFVLHLHGTDIRSLQYDPSWQAVIDWALRHARHVFYSTPDLAAHALPHRPDATYVPVPIDVGRLPAHRPDRDDPYVVVASRWEQVKGLDLQLETVQRLTTALAGRARVVGLDWGPGAPAAAAAGVTLLPRREHAAYLDLLAGAVGVVGQAGGILSASELEAIGIGVPVAVPVPLPLYVAARPPVLGGSPAEAADALVSVVGGHTPNDPEGARSWVAEHHRPAIGVDVVLEAYDRLAANGWRPR